jgi:integrase
MPASALRKMRDRTVFALFCLTGIRVAALTSLRIKHVDLVEKSVMQNPREVATKFGKRIDTFFANGFEEVEVALATWIACLDEVALCRPKDPLFPATRQKPAPRSQNSWPRLGTLATPTFSRPCAATVKSAVNASVR